MRLARRVITHATNASRVSPKDARTNAQTSHDDRVQLASRSPLTARTPFHRAGRTMAENACPEIRPTRAKTNHPPAGASPARVPEDCGGLRDASAWARRQSSAHRSARRITAERKCALCADQAAVRDPISLDPHPVRSGNGDLPDRCASIGLALREDLCGTASDAHANRRASRMRLFLF